MLGHELFYYLYNNNYDVFASVREKSILDNYYPDELMARIITKVDALDLGSIRKAIIQIRPDIVINCIGIIKQLSESKDHVLSISINALFPHQLASLCGEYNCRLIHVSTDCVFNGQKGDYTESDFPDADDLYGRTKYLGEVDYKNAVTLRTSIIGHELKGRRSLVDWFLSQNEEVNGFSNAIYSGFPTIEFASIIDKYVIPHDDLRGVYHVSSRPISKYDLLKLIAGVYGKKISIRKDSEFKIDRSLNSNRFRLKTGYSPPSWEQLVANMHDDYLAREHLYTACVR